MFRRYADDSIVAFERKDDAEAYLSKLPERLAKFGLELAAEKSALVKFNRWEPETSGRFTFFGFDFFWRKTLRNPKRSSMPPGNAGSCPRHKSTKSPRRNSLAKASQAPHDYVCPTSPNDDRDSACAYS